jgi:hypothetical protein
MRERGHACVHLSSVHVCVCACVCLPVRVFYWYDVCVCSTVVISSIRKLYYCGCGVPVGMK